MNLREFVKETLIQIVAGVADAQSRPPGAQGDGGPTTSGAIVNPTRDEGVRVIQDVEFDVAITASDATEAGGGLSTALQVVGLRLGASSASREESISRVRFSVPIVYPEPLEQQPKVVQSVLQRKGLRDGWLDRSRDR